jgi:hypothetical protein
MAITLSPTKAQGQAQGQESYLKTYAKVASALGIKQDATRAHIQEVSRPIAPWANLTSPAVAVTTSSLQVEIDKRTGDVLYVKNKTLGAALFERQQEHETTGRRSVPTCDAATLVATIEQFFTRTSGRPILNNLRLRIIEFDSERGSWNLGWARYIAGYLSDSEGLGACIDDSTGTIVQYTYMVTGATCRPVVRLSLEDASRKAQEHAERLLQKQARGEAYEVYSRESASLQIVYPNYAKTEVAAQLAEEDLRRAAKNPRLAYVFHFGFRYAGAKAAYVKLPPAVLWIDAENGKVLGGL